MATVILGDGISHKFCLWYQTEPTERCFGRIYSHSSTSTPSLGLDPPVAPEYPRWSTTSATSPGSKLSDKLVEHFFRVICSFPAFGDFDGMDNGKGS